MGGGGRREFGTTLDAALSLVETRIAESVARVLRPFLVAELRGQAIDALEESIGVLLRTDQAIIEISGAADLLDVLQSRVGAAMAIAWSPNSGADVRVVADQTVIESRIEAWARRIGATAETSS